MSCSPRGERLLAGQSGQITQPLCVLPQRPTQADESRISGTRNTSFSFCFFRFLSGSFLIFFFLSSFLPSFLHHCATSFMTGTLSYHIIMPFRYFVEIVKPVGEQKQYLFIYVGLCLMFLSFSFPTQTNSPDIRIVNLCVMRVCVRVPVYVLVCG